MKNYFVFIIFLLSLFIYLVSCSKQNILPTITNQISFKPLLSDYGIYQGVFNNLTPNSDYHFITLSSSLFVNYAEKQRLIKLPQGTKMTKIGEDLPQFPDGTILVKTFYYYHDVRSPMLGKRIIETRLLIKEADNWNVATYVWNDAQTEAYLHMDGLNTTVNWIAQNGVQKSITYHVPDQNECITCHQHNQKIEPLGPKLRNMNCTITSNHTTLNQLTYFQSKGLLDNFDPNTIAQLPDYNDTNVPLAERGRAYLEMNCAHCHHPQGYADAAKKRYDFRYTTPLSQTRISEKGTKIWQVMKKGEMPYLGTTTLDQEGVDLIAQYISSL